MLPERCVLLVLCLLMPVFPEASAAAQPLPSAEPQRPCVGLVLGGGGARGAAHIGVLRVLERERVPICAIAGTSMGAIVGALYASGQRPDDIERVLASVDWKDLFRDDPDRGNLPMRRKDAQLNYRAELELGWRDGGVVLPYGAVQGQKLGLLLRRMLLPVAGNRDFDELPIPFRAVATDIVTGEAVVFGKGDLAHIVRASMAVPAVFAPMEINGRLLVDGGLVDNVPIDIVRRMGADVVIAVDVGAPLLAREDLRSPASIAFQMVSVLMKERTKATLATLAENDVLIVPPLGDFSSAAFETALTVVPLGEQAAESQAPRLRDLAVSEADYIAWREQRKPPSFADDAIAFVEVDQRRTGTAALVAQRAQNLVGQTLAPERIDAAVQSAYAEGTYQRIGWRIVERDGRRGVELLPIDKTWGPMFASLGLQLSDDFNGRSDYQLTAELLRTGVSGDGDELRALLRLGRITELSADWFAPLDLDRRFYVGLDGGYRASNVPLSFGAQQAAEFRFSRTSLGARIGLQTDPRWALEANLRRSALKARRLVGLSVLGSLDQQVTTVGGRAVWDTLDTLSFPTRGTRAVATVDRHLDALGGEGQGWVTRLRSDTALSHGAHHLLLGARWARDLDQPPDLAAFSTLGGFLNLSGALERNRVGTRLAYGRAVYYYRIGDSNALLAVPTYLGFSAEVGDTWDPGQSFAFSDATRAGSVFVGLSSPFGPLLFGYGRTNQGEDSWTLSFGNLIRNED